MHKGLWVYLTLFEHLFEGFKAESFARLFLRSLDKVGRHSFLIIQPKVRLVNSNVFHSGLYLGVAEETLYVS